MNSKIISTIRTPSNKHARIRITRYDNSPAELGSIRVSNSRTIIGMTRETALATSRAIVAMVISPRHCFALLMIRKIVLTNNYISQIVLTFNTYDFA